MPLVRTVGGQREAYPPYAHLSPPVDTGRLPAGHCHPTGHDMDVVKSLTSGKNGSKHFVERYDAEQQIGYTTVELIVERKHKPPKPAPNRPNNQRRWYSYASVFTRKICNWR